MSPDPFLDPPTKSKWRLLSGSAGFWRWIGWGALVVLLGLVAYYPVGMALTHQINDDQAFAAPPAPAGASQAVALAAALIDREVRQTHWPANDPFFMPGWALDNMPNFQLGIKEALARFTNEMADQIGRSRGSSGSDPDLMSARGFLNYPPDVWLWNPKVSWWAPTASSESQYLAAMRSLLAYNDRLGKGQASFERRADNLMTTLDRIGKDLGAASNAIDRQIDDFSGQWIDVQADDVFYFNKGQLYAFSLLLRDLGTDFQKVIDEKGAGNVWQRMVASMSEGASLSPLIVINGKPGAMVQPNHLAAQGFYLLRARTQLEEITDILQK
jgi:hypothetical protein